ncbi:DUF3696 domain-containing protein [Ignavibacterium sp.]|jgi:hypothetical protein|uniref:AAA family ATPase n=2 Tax=Ignavibacterium TaxID=795750 RepID=UPI0025C26838|nr:DUF3696 domain-containing protein [Ignavibacterium sp.]
MGEIFILRYESPDDYYLEFHYCKAGDFIDIASFEFGKIDSNDNKNIYVKFEPAKPKSEYLKNVCYYDVVDNFNKELRNSQEKHLFINELSEYLEEIKSSLTKGLVEGLENPECWRVSYISQELINQYIGDRKINLNLLKLSLFHPEKAMRSITSGMKAIRAGVKHPNARPLTVLDFYVDEYGLSALNELNILEYYETLKFSFELTLLLYREMEDYILGWAVPPYDFTIIPETRISPPEYLEIENEKIKVDYSSFLEYWLELSEKEISYKKKFLKELKLFEIADNVLIKKIGNLTEKTKYLQIFLKYKERWFPINNLSSGGKQILPIIISLFKNKGHFIIKQPELHLHPKLQMKLPELFLRRIEDDQSTSLGSDIVTSGYSFTLETHSEHIIRKFQLLVASSASKFLTNKDISIIYVQPDKKSLTSSIKVMELDEKGNFIDNWPAGFFDESAELSYSLLEAQLKRKN